MIKKYNPTSPGRRHRIVIIDPSINTNNPLKKVKSLRKGKSNTGGRNNSGKITVRHRGGGHKKIVRTIDRAYKKGKYSTSTVLQIEYSPKMGGNIALCAVGSQPPFYRLATQNVTANHTFTGPFIKEDIPQDGDVKFLKNGNWL